MLPLLSRLFRMRNGRINGRSSLGLLQSWPPPEAVCRPRSTTNAAALRPIHRLRPLPHARLRCWHMPQRGVPRPVSYYYKLAPGQQRVPALRLMMATTPARTMTWRLSDDALDGRAGHMRRTIATSYGIGPPLLSSMANAARDCGALGSMPGHRPAGSGTRVCVR